MCVCVCEKERKRRRRRRRRDRVDDSNLHDNEILVRNPLLTLLIAISPDSSIFKGAAASDPSAADPSSP